MATPDGIFSTAGDIQVDNVIVAHEKAVIEIIFILFQSDWGE
jgi:hypothetical protein